MPSALWIARTWSMTRRSCFLEVLLEWTRVALPVEAVDRILRAVQVHAVGGAAGCLLGAIDVAGEIVPVYDLRRLLGLPGGPVRASDRFVLTRSPLRCALRVDEVLGTVDTPSIELTGEFGLHAAGLRGVTRGDNGLLLVHDLRRLLALERAVALEADG